MFESNRPLSKAIEERRKQLLLKVPNCSFFFIITSGLVITKKRFKSKTAIELLRKTMLNKLRGK